MEPLSQVIVVVIVAATSHIITAHGGGSFSFPEKCDGNSCLYSASWMSIPGGYADFTVTAKVKQSKWAGIGFSKNGRMIGSDAAVGWVTKDDVPILQDRFLFGKDPNKVPVDKMQNIDIKAISQKNGVLTYSFSRPIISPDKERDLDLTKCLYLLFAWGGHGNADGSITKHKYKMTTKRKVCFDNIPAPPLPSIKPVKTDEPPPSSVTKDERPAKNSFSFPENCDWNSCLYSATWMSVPGGYADFTVSAKVEPSKWAGIGVSKDGRMIGSDAAVGWVTKDGVSILQDRFLFGKDPNKVPVDKMQNIAIKAISQSNGVLTYSFSRPIISPDKDRDLDLTSCLFLCFAWGGYGNADGSITKHKYKMTTKHKVCFDNIPAPPLPSIKPAKTDEPPPSSVTKDERPAKNSFSFPENCDWNSCLYSASWMSVPGGYAHFKVSAKVEPSKWAGIGVSKDGRMIGSDAAVGWVTKDGVSILQDRFLFGKDPNKVPVDKMQNIDIKAISQSNGVLTYSFSRPIISPDKERDLDLTSCLFLCFAWGGYGNADGSITKHKYKMTTKHKVCFDNIPAPPLPSIKPVETDEPPPSSMTKDERPSKNSFSFPENCDWNSCLYSASWMSVPGGYADFKVSAKVEPSKWAGIGVSKDGRMIGSDAAVGWVTKDGVSILQDRYLFGKDPNKVPVDKMQNIDIKSISQNNGMLTYSFSRPIISPDKERDLDLTSCLFLCFAWGGYGNADGSITKHKYKMTTKHKVCFDNIPIRPMETDEPPPAETFRADAVRSCKVKNCPPNSKCVMEHGIARCYCLPEYPMDKYGNCRGKDVKPKAKDKCENVKCPDYAKCHDGHCSCKPGYYLEDKLCKRKITKPHGDDKCKYVKCQDHAKCHDGHCSCKPGYYLKDKFCKPKMKKPHGDDKCKYVKCQDHAKCYDGQCSCNDGYYLKDKICKPKMMKPHGDDKCKDMKCSKYAECKLGYCVCMEGYKLDHGICKKPDSMRDERKCGHVYCAEHAKCYYGKLCKCKEGYRQTPHKTCVPSSSFCHGKKCHHNAYCNHYGKCQCNSGYVEYHGYCKHVDPCKKMNCGPYHSCVVRYHKAMCVHSYPNYHMYSCMGKCGKYNYYGRCSCKITCLRMGGCCGDFTKYCTRMPGHPYLTG